MQALRARILRIADSPSRVLILGENGVGKQLLAEALHENSSRRDKQLITLNCAAVPSELIESELFGHEKGAFTGAATQRPGKFEQAAGSTLFLDEVGDMPLAMQAKLLRVLQTGAYERVGGKLTLSASSVRVISATNRDLRADVTAGRFREDLYFRLAVIPLYSPALRDRIEDVAVIANAILARLGVAGLSGVTLDDSAQLALMYHSWPGNVRELENVLERMLAFAEPGRLVLTEYDVRDALGLDMRSATANSLPDVPPSATTVDALAAAASVAAIPVDSAVLYRATFDKRLSEMQDQIDVLSTTMSAAVSTSTAAPPTLATEQTAHMIGVPSRARIGDATFKTGDWVMHRSGRHGIVESTDYDCVLAVSADELGRPIIPVVRERWQSTDLVIQRGQGYTSLGSLAI